MSADAIADGTVVTIHYVLKDDEGKELDSSAGGDPLAYLHGAGNIVPGLEKQLLGRAVGDKLTAAVPAEEGYGAPQPPGPHAVPRSAFPEGELQPGMQFMAQDKSGNNLVLWVVQVSDEQVVVDNNHPLAGMTLHFEVEVVGVRGATDEERAHGHPHGPGGAHH